MKLNFTLRKNLTKQDQLTICEDYKSGISAPELAVKWDKGVSAICRVLKKNNIEVRGQTVVPPMLHVEGIPTKICSVCNGEFSINNFQKKLRNGENYGGSRCSDCRRLWLDEIRAGRTTYKREYDRNKKINDWSSYIYSAIKNRCKRTGTEFSFDKKSFNNWYDSLESYCCEYCKLTKDEILSIPDNTLSIDRKDNLKGYIPGNITLCCVICNFMKQDLMSYEDMLAIGPSIGARLKLRLPKAL